MKNHILLIGDRLGGIEPGLGDLVADLMLVDFPELPLSFTVHSSSRNTVDHLFQNCPREIIGRRAGTTVLCVGWEDLQSALPGESLVHQYFQLLQEILHNSHSEIVACTLPCAHFPTDSLVRAKAQTLNSALRATATDQRLTILDLDRIVNDYQNRQLVRGDLFRNLFTDQNSLNALGQMLCARAISSELSSSLK